MMSTATIAVVDNTTAVVLVNVFTVEPARQEELLEELEKATTSVFVHVPGFVSANLHTSLDGRRVVNYAQWTDAESYQQAIASGEMREHLTTAADIADSYDPMLVRVRSVTPAPGRPA